MPLATIEKVAVWPAKMAWLGGWAVIEGATEEAVTERVAAVLVTFPTELLTITLNCAPLSDEVAPGVM